MMIIIIYSDWVQSSRVPLMEELYLPGPQCKVYYFLMFLRNGVLRWCVKRTREVTFQSTLFLTGATLNVLLILFSLKLTFFNRARSFGVAPDTICQGL